MLLYYHNSCLIVVISLWVSVKYIFLINYILKLKVMIYKIRQYKWGALISLKVQWRERNNKKRLQ